MFVFAKKDYRAFPIEVQHAMGYALGLAQLGAKHPKAKPWKGEGTGLFEIVEDHSGDAYRAVYTVRFADVERVESAGPELVLVMKDGVVVEQASAAQILAAPREDYTKRLLAAIPRGYRAAA